MHELVNLLSSFLTENTVNIHIGNINIFPMYANHVWVNINEDSGEIVFKVKDSKGDILFKLPASSVLTNSSVEIKIKSCKVEEVIIGEVSITKL